MEQGSDLSNRDFLRITLDLLKAELVSGVFGLKLFIACVTLATFMMSAVWILGEGLSNTLSRSGTTFLGADVAISTVNVPVKAALKKEIERLGETSEVIELRTQAQRGDKRFAIELKGIDQAYPFYGQVELQSGRSLKSVLEQSSQTAPILVEATLLSRLAAQIGDEIKIGAHMFRIADVLVREPDRLSAGRFMVGPRVLIARDVLDEKGIIQPGALVDYRFRIKATQGNAEDLYEQIRALEPATGWEIESPKDAGDRVLRTVDRATTFLGMAGIAAFLIGLSGAWAAAQSWIRRRARTIALYRLSGASAEMVLTLHGAIILMASLIGLIVGLGASLALALPLLDMITLRLHVPWDQGDVMGQTVKIFAMIVMGLIGTGILALSGVYHIAPGTAMRNGEAVFKTDPRQMGLGLALIAGALVFATLSLPFAGLAALAMTGLIFAILLMALMAHVMARAAAQKNPKNFMALVICQNLSNATQTASRSVAIGIGIIGITAIFVAQQALQTAIHQEVPDKVPDLVLIDVQPHQVSDLQNRIERSTDFSGFQSDPFMRMSITAVNGIPARDALVLEDKSWVIEGDRSFSWTAEPTGAELLDGAWWPADYNGPALISPEEDVMEAFDLKVGDTLTYSFLGRSFTSEVVNIRKEYHRTFRPEYLMVASPYPFKTAPHTWVMSFKGESNGAIDNLINELSQTHPNITSIDIRPIVSQLSAVISGTIQATLLIAGLLTIAGALSLGALVASDVDARRKEALVFMLVGASRKEIALIRLSEAVAIGLIAAILGGLTGIIGGYFITTQAIRVDWSFDPMFVALPFILGMISSLVAGFVGGMGAAPSGRGQMIRQLTSS